MEELSWRVIAGEIVNPEDEKTLAEGIKKGMELPIQEASLLINNARELVRARHSHEEYFSKLEQIFVEVAPGSTDISEPFELQRQVSGIH